MTQKIFLLDQVLELLRTELSAEMVSRLVRVGPGRSVEVCLPAACFWGSVELCFRFHEEHGGVECFLDGSAIHAAGRDLDGFSAEELANAVLEVLKSGFVLRVRTLPFFCPRVEHLRLESDEMDLPFEVPLLFVWGRVVEIRSHPRFLI